MAAVHSCGDEKIGEEEFLAFHLSGGTTELLFVRPDRELGFAVSVLGATLDLSAGQLIDRVGVMLGLSFPCGGSLERLAAESASMPRVHVCVRGFSCNLSGAENVAQKLFREGAPACDVARFALRNAAIRSAVAEAFSNVWFAEPSLSSDNAVGTAYLGLAKRKRERG